MTEPVLVPAAEVCTTRVRTDQGMHEGNKSARVTFVACKQLLVLSGTDLSREKEEKGRSLPFQTLSCY